MSILYHYCSSEAFHSIISKKQIWLSSLRLSNDLNEGKVIMGIVEEFVASNGGDIGRINLIKGLINRLDERFDAIGFCLSSGFDLLSQWVRYADDGHGIAIGFSKEYLEGLAAAKNPSRSVSSKLTRVIYEKEEQKLHVSSACNALNTEISSGVNQDDIENYFNNGFFVSKESGRPAEKIFRINKNILESFYKFYSLKESGFCEEAEWRLLARYSHDGNDHNYRANKNKIVGYMPFSLERIGEWPIKEVVLGPRNISDTKTVQGFLRQNGFHMANVVKSKIPYR